MDIAVIGSGIAGLAAATQLARDGHAVTIFEKFDAPKPLGAGLLLQPTGLAALESLGLRGEAEARGAQISRLLGRTPSGRSVLDLRYREGRPGDRGVGIHRASLFNLLHQSALDAGVSWRTSAGVDAIETMRERPQLVLESGERTPSFDLALVADGAHSNLRHAVCPNARESLYRWGAVWAICPSPGGARDGDLDQVYDGCRTMIGLLPVGDNPADPDSRPAVSFFWSLPIKDIPKWRATGLDRFKQTVAHYWPRAGEAIAEFESLDDFTPARYRDGVCPTWRCGATILIGDAAHAMSPQLGQGANLALADAVALAQALRDHASLTHALPAFEKKRRPIVSYYSLMSRALTPVFQSHSRIVGWLRDTLFSVAGRLPGIRNWMAWTLAGRGRLPW